MAKVQGSPDVRNMTDRQMFDELITLYGETAGKTISSILKTEIEITDQSLEEKTVKGVEYSILEPAIFVKSCLTSNVAGCIVFVLRQRDMQVFLNDLMGVDDLPDPDFAFDEVAMSAAGELMNQMLHSCTPALARYLGDTMDSSDCQLYLSDDGQNLASVLGEDGNSLVSVVHYQMRIHDSIESEFIQCLSATAVDSIMQEITAKIEREVKEAQEQQQAEAAMLIGGGKNQKDGNMAAGGAFGLSEENIAGLTAGAAMAGGVQYPGMSQSGYRGAMVPIYQDNLGLIMDVPLAVTVEIGKTKRRLKDVLNFNNGTVIELDKQADAPVDIIINGQLIARGEVVVIDDNFGVRISEIVNTKNIIGNGE